MNQQLQDQLSALREEHQNTLQQLKEAHALLQRHIENSAKLSASEVHMWTIKFYVYWAVLSLTYLLIQTVKEEEIKELREVSEVLQQQLESAKAIHAEAVDKHSKEIAQCSEKVRLYMSTLFVVLTMTFIC